MTDLFSRIAGFRAQRSVLFITLLGALLLAAAQGCERKPPRPPLKETDWATALRVFAQLDQGQPASGSLFGVPLAGYSYHQIFESGRSNKFIILVYLDHGYILAFQTDGSFAAAAETRQILSLMAVDLNSDGQTQMILGQLDAYGTGLFWKNYHAYVLAGKSLDDYIIGELHVVEAARSDDDGNPIVERDILGFIQFDEGRAGIPSTIIHVAYDVKKHRYTQTAYQLDHGRIKKVPVPAPIWSTPASKKER